MVFNTVLTGYQEVITDPSYAGQIITFTTPHIGNYGVTDLDHESRRPFCRGIVIRELARRSSSWRKDGDLDQLLHAHGIPGIAGIDTRRLTRHIRDAGAMPGAFGTADEATLKQAAISEPGTDGLDLAAAVTCDQPYLVESAGSHGSTRRIVAIDLRHQVHNSAPLGHARIRRGGALNHACRRHRGQEPRRRVPLERARRSKSSRRRGVQHC